MLPRCLFTPVLLSLRAGLLRALVAGVCLDKCFVFHHRDQLRVRYVVELKRLAAVRSGHLNAPVPAVLACDHCREPHLLRKAAAQLLPKNLVAAAKPLAC